MPGVTESYRGGTIVAVLTMSRRAMQTESPDAAKSTRDSALARIADYIPSDVLATYLAMLGILAPTTPVSKWVVFFLAIGLAVVLPVLNWMVARSRLPAGEVPPSFAKQGWVILFGVVAFTIYAATIPESVFASYYGDVAVVAGVAALILALVLPLIGELLKVNTPPPDRKALDIRVTRRQAPGTS